MKDFTSRFSKVSNKNSLKLMLVLVSLLFHSTVFSQLVISQYIETNSGSVPKGIEIWNASCSTIDFAATPLTVFQGTNGGVFNAVTGATVSTGTLGPGEVVVIGTTDIGTYLTTVGLGTVIYEPHGFSFNGNDALEIRLGGVPQDRFGTLGVDPSGGGWSGTCGATNNTNLELLALVYTGDTAGFSDPCTRFTELNEGDSLLGFGIAPLLPLCISPLSANAFCQGDEVSINYNSTQTVFNAGNVFSLQLSDATGSFTAPLVIATDTSVSASGSFLITIPPTTIPGTGYRMRLVSSNPVTTGIDNGSDITIGQAATANAGPDIPVCGGEEIGLGGSLGGAASSALWVGGIGLFPDGRSFLPSGNAYIPDQSEWGSTVTLLLITNDPAGVCPSDTDAIDIEVLATPLLAPLGQVSNTCPLDSFDLNTLTIVDSNNTTGFITFFGNNGSGGPGVPLTSPWVDTTDVFFVFKTVPNPDPLKPDCFDFQAVTVIILPCSSCVAPTLTETHVDLNCNGDLSGSIDLTATGGIGPYTYLWSNAATTQDISGLAAGNYFVTVTGSDSCTAQLSINITEPAALSLTSAATDVSCNGAMNGAIDLSVSGGTSAYSYAWSLSSTGSVTVNPLKDNTIYENLSVNSNGAGEWFIAGNNNSIPPSPRRALMAFDIASSSIPAGATITGATLTLAMTHTSAGAGARTFTLHNLTSDWGEGTSNAGTPPGSGAAATTGDATWLFNFYPTVLWSPAGGSFNASSSASQTVDAIGSYSWSSATMASDVQNWLDNPSSNFGWLLKGDESTAQTSKRFASKENTTAAIPVLTLTYLLGNTSEDLTGLSGGIYTVTVTDNLGCTAVLTDTVNESSAILSSISASAVLCASDSALLDLTVSGGTPALSYLWSNGATTEDIYAFTSGTYSVIITDANNCTDTAFTTVNFPTAITFSPSIIAVTCPGASDGAADPLVSGGTGAYTYQWSNGSTDALLFLIGGGDYTVTVTDASGCVDSTTITVTEPAAIIANELVTNISCNAINDGAIDISPTGGSFPYTFAWSNGQTTEDITGLLANTYTVTITDVSLCVSTFSFIVSEPTVININNFTVDNFCNGDTIGSINITVTGGTPGITVTEPIISEYIEGSSNNKCLEIYNGTAANMDMSDYRLIRFTNGSATASSTLNLTGTVTSKDVLVICNTGANASMLAQADITTGIVNHNGDDAYALIKISSGDTIDIIGQIGCDPGGSWSSGIISTQNQTLIRSNTVQAGVSNNPSGACSSSSFPTLGSEWTSLPQDDATDLGMHSGAPSTPYAYIWSTGSTDEDLANLGADTYTVTVTDLVGCTQTAEIIVNEASELTVQCVVGVNGNIECFGGNDGAISSINQGGTLPYTYQWKDSTGAPIGINLPIISSLTAGEYTLVVTDANGCKDSCSTILTQPPALTLSLTETNISCFGAGDGSVDAIIGGGTTPYTFAWSNGATTEDISGLGPNVYTLTVTDINNCSITSSVSITEPAPISANALNNGPVCTGNSINLSVTPAAASYNWSGPAGFTSAFQNPTFIASTVSEMGNYSVVITDVNGCTDSTGTSVTVLASPDLAAVANQTNACPDGFVDLTALTLTDNNSTVGTLTYWTDASLTVPLTNPDSVTTSGIYHIQKTTTSIPSCSDAVSVNVTIQTCICTPPALTETHVNVLCFGENTGSIDLSVNTGTSPFTYLWSNGETTQDIDSLTMGTYTVTVMDAQPCTSVLVIQITEPASALSVTFTPTNATCNGFSTGALLANISGGTSAYSVLWDNASTDNPNTTLSAGSYSVTVTDANGCTIISTGTVSEPDAITAIVSITHATCNGASTGAIDITPAGGTGAYSYLWSNTSTMEDISGLAAGSYTVIITDINSCTKEETYSVTEPAALQLSSIVTNTLCNGDNNGAINLSVNGGTASYSYLWSTTATTEDISGLVAGDYIVTVTDFNLCVVTDTIAVSQPDSFTFSSTVTDVSCFGGSDGSIVFNLSGGTPIYTFNWSSGATTQNVGGLSAGAFTILWGDSNGCTDSTNIVIGSPDILLTNPTVVNPSCNGDSTGYIDINPTGGTAPYTFAWSDGSTNEDIGNLSAGFLYGRVFDVNGCKDSTGYNLLSPSAVNIIGNITNVSCNGDSSGAIDITVSGGTPHAVSADIFISQYIEGSSNNKAVEIYNPTAAAVDLSDYVFLRNNSGSTLNVDSFFVSGILNPGDVYVIANSNAVSAILTQADTTGSFTFYSGDDVIWIRNMVTNKIVDVFGNIGCDPGTEWTAGTAHTKEATLIRKAFVQNGVGIDPFNPPCDFPSLAYEWITLAQNDFTDLGTHTINTVQSYTYEWSNGSTTEDISTLSAGTYTVTSSDANGCTSTFGFTVNEPAALALSCSSTNVICNSAADGTASVSVSGGTGSYSYAWSNGASDASISSLIPDTYTVIVTDSLGCSDSCSVTISEPAILTLNCSSTNATCNGVANGTASVNAAGGTGTLTYSWSTGATTSSISALSPATYTVIVTDSLGCLDSCSVTIIEPSAISLSSVSINTTCNGGSDGSINVTIAGGTTPYVFSWSNSATTEDLTAVVAGIYTLNILDFNNCSASITDTIDDALPLLIDSVSIDCSLGAGLAAVTVHATNPAANALEYSIDGGVNYFTTPTFTGLADGLFNVAVRDTVLGCEDSLMNVLVNCALVDPCFNDTLAPVITCPPTITVDCIAPANYPDISAFVTAGGTVVEICDIDSVAFTFSDSIVGTCPQTIYRKYNIADLTGNVGSCVQLITVQDTMNPVITLTASSLTVQCDGSGNTADLTNWLANNAGAAATDNCGTATFSNNFTGMGAGCGATGSVLVTFTVVDLCNNSSSTSATFTINDTTAPVLTIPANATVNCDSDNSPAALGMASATDICDNAVNPTSTDSIVSGSCANESTIFRIWTATDACGNSVSANQVITVQDTSAPVLIIPANVTLNCGDDTSTANTGTASVTDNCINGAILTYSDIVNAGTCPIIEVITRTWTATDSCNNSASAVQTITVKDTLPPVPVCMVLEVTLDASGSATITPADIDGGSFNSCGGGVTLSLSQTTFDCSNVGNNTVTLYVTDACGNIDSCGANVVVKDNISPIALCQPVTVYVDANCSATISTSDINNGSSDICGIDTMILSQTTFGSANIGTGDTILANAVFAYTGFEEPFAGAQYNDTGDGAVSHALVNNPGQSYVNYTTVGGELGFTSHYYFITSTTGLTDGDFVGASTFTGTVGSYTTGVQGFQMSDTDGEMETSLDVVNITGLDSAKVSIDLFVASTGWESADAIRIYVVFEDNTELDLINTTGSDIDNLSIEGSWMTLTGDLSGHTSAELRVSLISNAGTEAIYVDNVRFTSQVETTTNVVTLTVFDVNGNSSSCSALVTVLDTITPIAPLAPADTTVLCAGDVPAPVALTALDNCTGSITVNPTAQIIPGVLAPCSNNFLMIRTWTFTDSSGNSSSVSQTITVNDTIAPAAPAAPGDTTVLCAGDIPSPVSLTAQDNCGYSVLANPTGVITAGSCSNNFVMVRTWTFTDSCGNSSSVSQTITVNDSIAPTAPAAPANVTVACASDIPAPVSLTATDNCGYSVIANPTGAITAGSCSNNFVMVRTWTFTDSCGNSSSVSQTITVNDSIAPTAPAAPANVTVACASDIPAPAGLTATDNCGYSVNATPTGAITAGSCSNNFVMVRTWTFTDSCGNASSVSQTITVNDSIAPTAPAAPANVTVACASDIPSPVSLTATDNCGYSVIANPTGAITPGSCSNNFVMVRTWTFTDSCGNASSVSQTITVNDSIAPAAPAAPANVTVACASDIPSPVSLTATDNCGYSVIANPTVAITAGSCSNNFVMVRTWTFTDSCGNASSVSQTITVNDSIAPTAPAAPGDTTITCPAVVPPPVSLTATDNCGYSIVANPTGAITPGSCSNDYIMVRTWTFTDSCGNSSSVSQTITVIDTIAPTLPVPPADVTVACASDIPAPVNLIASSDCGLAIDVNPTAIITPGSCNNNFVMVRTWTFTDSCGNSSSVSQTITVNDSIAPTTPPAPANITVACASDIPSPVSLTATDNCGYSVIANPTGSITTGSCNNNFVMVRTWIFTDSCGNSSSVSQTITVNDSIAPTAPPAPANVTVACASDIPAPFSLTATDNCGYSVIANPTGTITPGSCSNNFVMVRTWIFTDSCGNSSSVSQTITVNDSIAPTAPPAPANVTVACASDIPAPVSLTATDNCGYSITVTPTGTILPYTGCSNQLIMVRTWTFTDSCGNSSSTSQTITVNDSIAPTAPPAPANVTVACASDIPAPVSLTATDNCGYSVIAIPTGAITPGSCNNNFVMVRTWTFTDSCGNSSSVSQTITVNDSIAPIAPPAPANVTVACASDIPAPAGLTATDNCGYLVIGIATGAITPGSCNNNFVMVRTWSFTDSCGNSSSVSQTIMVNDSIAPVAPPAPANVTVACASDIPAPVSLTATDNCGYSVLANPTGAITSGSCINNFVMVRTWTFTDSCGNSSSISQTITVNDSIDPVINIPPNYTISCNDNSSPSALGTATATDNCGAVNITMSDSLVSGSCPLSPSIYRTWTATDTCGNTASGVQIITIQDTVPFTIACSHTNVDCHGAGTGSASVGVISGTGPFTYLWNTGATSSSISGIPAGFYAVTVFNSFGGNATCTIDVLEPNPIQASATVIDDISCFGAADGKLAVSALGGISPYSYTWVIGIDTIAIGDTVSNMPTGNYIVYVSDANGCVFTTNVSLINPAQILINESHINVLCYGEATGSINITTSNGQSPYTYLWSNNSTDEDQFNLVAGIYTVTVTDNAGCQALTAVNIFENPQIVVGASQGNVICQGSSNGNATVSVAGGIGPYTYSWNTSPVQTGQTAFNLAAGNYEVTIIDAVGCDTIIPFTIFEPTLLDATAVTTNVSCYGANDGTATITNVIGGIPPYTVVWNPFSNPVNSYTVSGLAAGTHTAQVTDSNLCVTTVVVTITQPQALFCQFNINHISCPGGSNGKLTSIISGGTGPYSYVWSNGATSVVNAGLSAGTYTVTVTDASGCLTTCSATIVEPAPLNYSVIVEDITCAGNNDGKIIVNVTGGGSPPYTYTWNTVPSQTTSIASNLSAGQYSLVISDAAGCLTAITETVSENPPLLITPTITNVTCNSGNDGAIILSAIGGISPYSVLWSNGNSTLNNTGLQAGLYTVILTDSVGCVFTDSYLITEPSAISLTAAITHASCNGSSNGSITVTASGGNGGPYTYNWSNGQTTQTAQSLAAGPYVVTVTGSNGCVVTETYVITQQSLIGMTANINNVSCAGGSNGNATALPTGGTAPYSYLWSNGHLSQTANGLIAGAYTVQITDANGCVKIGNVTVTEPDSLTCTSTLVNIPCSGQTTGAISVSVSGGTAPYTYLWSTTPAQTTSSVSGLTSGNYNVTITDSKGCVIIKSFTISQPGNITLTTSKHNVSCKGGMDGTATVSANGGTAPYTYLWSTNAAHTTDFVIGLTAGTYTVTVTDAGGCTAISSVLIRQPSPLITLYIPTGQTCSGANDGSINLLVAGGTAPYTYLWSTGATDEDLLNVGAGVYYVLVRDRNGCASLATVYLSTSNPLNISATIMDVSCSGGNDGGANVFTVGGTAPYSYVWSNGQSGSALTNVIAGTYFVTVTDVNSCSAVSSVSVNEPSPLSCSIAIVDSVACYGDTTGKLQVIVNGGTAPYTYSWSTNPIQNTAVVNNVGAGTYSVIVIDANGCSTICSINLGQPASLVCTDTSTEISCNNASDGTASVVVSGGVAPYSYIWSTSPVQTNATATGLSAGTYTVFITDNNGCTLVKFITLLNPQALQLGISSTNVTCSGLLDGSATVTATGGNSPYTYNWTSGAGTPTASGLASGTYTVTVSDANGCSATASVEIFIDNCSNVGDFTWIDLNGNGIFDSGEPAVGGVLVTLHDSTGAIVGTMTTDPSGAYLFTNVAPGNYYVSFGNVPGYNYTVFNAGGSQVSGANGPGTTNTFTVGVSNVLTIDQGYLGTGTIGDFVWEDLNNNGIQDDGPTGIANAVVQLTWAGPDGILGTTDDVISTDTTDANGGYLFSNLPMGNYEVMVIDGGGTVLAGLTNTTGGNTTTTALTPGSPIDLTQDFGYVDSVNVGDFTWIDVNGNGIFDSGEPAVGGVLVTLHDSTGAIVGTMTTDPSGAYLFTNVLPGDYYVTFGNVPGYTYTVFNAGGSQVTGANGPGTTNTFTVANTDVLTIDQGYLGTGTIGDFVWEDLNNNGIQDDGPTGIANAVVQLTWAGPDGILGTTDDVISTDTTDANGGYLFSNLPMGNYEVMVIDGGGTVLAGLTNTTGGNTTTTALTPGSPIDLTQDFGYVDSVNVGDFTWIDVNGNGIFDSGEPAVGGVLVTLHDSTGAIVGTMTTDPSGAYLFTNVLPGDYYVTFGNVPGYTYTVFNAGGSQVTGANGPGTTNTFTVANTDVLTIDQGYLGTGTIGDFVWEDLNNNGIQDDGPTGIANAVVQLTWAGPDGILGTTDDVISTDTTDANGGYLFSNLPMGNYEVMVIDGGGTVLAGLTNTTGGNTTTTALTPGSPIDLTQDFGYVDSVNVGDFTWIDVNGNGIFDSGEPAVGGVLVTLHDSTGAIVGTMTTDPSGAYLFTNVLPGDYYVTFGNVPGYTYTVFNAGGSQVTGANGPGTTNTFTVANTDVLTIDQGYLGTGTIGDFVWEDLNNNGIQDDGPTGIANAVVQLTWAGPDGILGTTDDVISTDTTDANGGYLFSNLPMGNYEVMVIDGGGTVLAGLTNTTGGNTTTTALTPGSPIDLTQDFGYVDSVNVGDFTWIDVNGNGIFDSGEPAVGGVLVTLHDSTGAIVGTMTTDPSGAYLFTNVLPGDYYVTFGNVPGYTYTVFNAGGSQVTGANGPGTTNTFTVANTDVLTIDQGYLGTGTIGDFVWEDLNNNGIQDDGPTGIANAVVQLTWAGPDGILGTTDDVISTDTTDANGGYLFSNLPMGNYEVMVIDGGGTVLAGLTNTTGGNTTTTALTPGSPIDLTQDFGYVDSVNVGDFTWIDVNGNGIFDSGEPAVGGVLVTLHDSTGAIVGTMTTDPSGAYLFTNVLPGDYYVTFGNVPGYTYTVFNAGGSQVTGANGPGTTNTFTVANTDVLTIDQGYLGTGTIGDFVWEDLNNNGIQDDGPTGIANAVVQLTWAGPDGILGTTDDVISTDTTDANGGYLFSNLPMGNYEVMVIDGGGTVLAGLTNTTGGNTTTTALTPGSPIDLTQDFGYVDSVNVGDFTWIDVNGNGIFDSGEPAVGGVLVTLHDSTGAIVGTMTTDPSGAYLFTNVLPGDYYVTFGNVPGYTYTVFNAGGSQVTGANGPGTTNTFTVANTDVLTIDQGYLGTGTIGDFVWEDLNNNGIQDDGPTGFDSVVVQLTWAGPDGLIGTSDDVVTTDTTDVNGNYLFTNLPVGNYQVVVFDNVASVLNGYMNTTGGNISTTMLSVGNMIDLTLDFGYTMNFVPLSCGTVTGSVINCGASNGTVSVSPIGGFPPYSYFWNTNPPQTTATATGLPVGTYLVQVTDQLGSSSAIFCFATVTCNQVKTSDATLNAADSDWSILVYPNPTSGHINLGYFAEDGQKILVEIRDVTGRVIMAANETATLGANQHEYNLSSMPKGIYFIIVQNKDARRVERIILH